MVFSWGCSLVALGTPTSFRILCPPARSPEAAALAALAVTPVVRRQRWQCLRRRCSSLPLSWPRGGGRPACSLARLHCGVLSICVSVVVANVVFVPFVVVFANPSAAPSSSLSPSSSSWLILRQRQSQRCRRCVVCVCCGGASFILSTFAVAIVARRPARQHMGIVDLIEHFGWKRLLAWRAVCATCRTPSGGSLASWAPWLHGRRPRSGR